jgi:hypothetical protein
MPKLIYNNKYKAITIRSIVADKKEEAEFKDVIKEIESVLGLDTFLSNRFLKVI